MYNMDKLNTNKIIATLGLSWNFGIAESLASLSLQDGPQSGIILSLDPTHPPPPTQQPLFVNWNISATHDRIMPKF